MFCRKCGKTVPDDSKFCPYCGETVIVEAEERPKEHGFCKNCGNPLPDGKLFGLCDDCLNRSGIETAEFGRCENCGKPLGQDDGALCQECAEKMVSEHSPYPLKGSKETRKSGSAEKPHKAVFAVFAVICVLVIGCIAANSIPANAGSAPSTASSKSQEEIDIKNKAQTAAIAWAMDNMQKYGKISDDHFEDGYEEGKYMLLYRFRAPNAFGAAEQHKLYLNYQKDSSDWNLVSVMLDGDEIVVSNVEGG